MKNLALLALVVLVPVAAGAGYAAHRQAPPPPPLTIPQAIAASGLKQDPSSPSVSWLYVVTSGVLKGQETDATTVVKLPAKQLEGYPGRYIVRNCTFRSTSGRENELFDKQIVAYCTQRKVTKAAVLEHVAIQG